MEYKDQFKFLVEYNVKTGINLESTKSNEITEEEEVEIVPNTPPAPVEFENTEEVNKLPEFEDLVKKNDLNRVKDIQDLQTKEIENLASQLQSLTSEYSNVAAKLESIEDTQIDAFINFSQKIKALTPPTPQESLEKMVKITGGMTIDDYFKNFDQEIDNRNRTEAQIAKDKYVLNLKDLYNGVSSNDSEIKNSLTNF